MIHHIGEADEIRPGINVHISDRLGADWIAVYVKHGNIIQGFRAFQRGGAEPDVYHDVSEWFDGENSITRCNVTGDEWRRAEAREYWWPYSEQWA